MGAEGVVLKSLESLDGDSLFRAFSSAFADYEMQLNREELESMLNRRGFEPGLSFGAFHNGNLVSFTFNGIGNYRGEKTAYDTGTGTLKKYRGGGLATRVFKHSIPHLRKAGISRYLLEVLQHNKGAVSVYSKLGFEITREFNYFSCSLDEVKVGENDADVPYEIKSVDLSACKDKKLFWDFVPSWQNDFGSIERSPADFKMIGAFREGEMAGYAIFAPDSGDVTQIAVDKSKRRQGIGTSLIRAILEEIQHPSMKLINTEISCDSLTGFLSAFAIPLAGTQYEMQRKL